MGGGGGGVIFTAPPRVAYSAEDAALRGLSLFHMSAFYMGWVASFHDTSGYITYFRGIFYLNVDKPARLLPDWP